MASASEAVKSVLSAARAPARAAATHPRPRAPCRPRSVGLGRTTVARESIAEGHPCNLGDVEAFVKTLGLYDRLRQDQVIRLFSLFSLRGATGMELGHAAWSTRRQGKRQKIIDPVAYAVAVFNNQACARGQAAGAVVPLRRTG